MERQIGKYYVYSYSRGLLVREATANEVRQAEALNAGRINKLTLCNDDGIIEKYLGVNPAYSQGAAD